MMKDIRRAKGILENTGKSGRDIKLYIAGIRKDHDFDQHH